MSDPHIDAHEILGYGPFAADQIATHVVGLDPPFDAALTALRGRLTSATSVVRDRLAQAGQLAPTTFTGAEGDGGPVATAKDVLERAVSYVRSRPDGKAIAAKMLVGEALSTVTRRRPAKLVGALGHAAEVVKAHQAKLPESAAWEADLRAAQTALDTLDKSVRKSRLDRRAMTPEIQQARADWLVVYGAAKLLVEAVLRLHGKTAMMPEIFDDLAEVHRVPGVSDGPAPDAPKPG